jgi:hypothetical protein
MGDNVVYVKGKEINKFYAGPFVFSEPDKIYITTLFTYEYKEVIKTIRFYKSRFPNSKIIVGGILASLLPDLIRKEGVEVHVGLWEEVEDFPPDYSLFPEMDYSLTFTSRGCINKCAFCVVPKLEGKFYSRDWLKDIDTTKKKIIFMDNNWLAKDADGLRKDIKNMRMLCNKKGITNIDFNQSLDCRLITEKHYKLLAGIPIHPLRFSFDNLSQDKYCQNAIKLAYKYGFNHIHVDVLYNFNDTIEDFYYRIKELIRLIGKKGGGVILMKYAPIDRIDKDYVGKYWTKKEAESVHRINPYPYGIISSKSMKEFEHFFGRDATEFKKLLNFKDIRLLSKLKMGKFSLLKVDKKIIDNV